MQTNYSGLEKVIELYSPIVEKSYPGKSGVFAAVIRSHWDSNDERIATTARGMDGGIVTINEHTVTSIVRELCIRKPAFYAAVKALKN